ncbi:sorting nexin-14 [Fopius arisanus]|uniref:Snx14_1 protein n=2 Tax=Fopius arisanus TaxID=64838 RepID=A0A0C9RN56_9HYME|nr:PREDICTED: sorting nexin-14-like [Fopius arisanus]
MIDTRYVFMTGPVILGLFLAIFDSIAWALVIILTYSVSALWGVTILDYLGVSVNTHLPGDVCRPRDDGACRVCSGSACNRHKPSVYNTHVKVPKDFDVALQNLLETVLQTYVCEWYSTFSSDEAFLQELRLTIATAARNIISRLFRADISEVIFNNLIPVALQHAEDWRLLAIHARKNGNKPEDNVIDYLGHRIHPAALSRDAELNYLRGLVTGFIPHLIPSSYISTNNKVILREILANWVLLPAMDALSDPDTINFLVELCTQYQGDLSQELDAVEVPALQSWITPRIIVQDTEDPLKPSLEQVLESPELLYLFMQHIKESGPVNLLQFCLDIDDLSKRMLTPDMTSDLEESLYTSAQSIYSSYLDPEGGEYLHLPWHISQGMHDILEGGPSKVQELRTSRPLYQAHQEAHARLEAICLPSFHHSFELYKLLCGSPVSATFTRSASQHSTMSGGPGVGARLSNQLGRIRGVLRASAVDGAPFQSPDVFQAEEVDCTPRTFDSALYEDKSARDLTTWRVTVPHVDGGGAFPLYMIAVHSVAEDKSWTVLRRDQDFHVLRARLMEFHGDREMNDSPLPTRKNQTASLTANRQRYQDFLQKLVAKPTLRSSELLHIFLTAPNLKSYLTNYSTPDIGILYQNVAHKLRKEKGQHLDKFMSTLLASTFVKYEHADLGIEPVEQVADVKKGRNFRSTVFEDNLGIKEMKELPYISTGTKQVKGASFCVAGAVENLLGVSGLVSQCTWLLASLARSSLDSVCNKFMNRILMKLLSGGRAAVVVKLLHNAMFEEKSSIDVNPSSRAERYKSAKEGLHSLLPWWCFGLHTNYWCKLMDALLEPLQNPFLNKHLAYVLVDQVLVTLFPEISQI